MSILDRRQVSLVDVGVVLDAPDVKRALSVAVHGQPGLVATNDSQPVPSSVNQARGERSKQVGVPDMHVAAIGVSWFVVDILNRIARFVPLHDNPHAAGARSHDRDRLN
jgi:hypothetical protein